MVSLSRRHSCCMEWEDSYVALGSAIPSLRYGLYRSEYGYKHGKAIRSLSLRGGGQRIGEPEPSSNPAVWSQEDSYVAIGSAIPSLRYGLYRSEYGYKHGKAIGSLSLQGGGHRIGEPEPSSNPVVWSRRIATLQ